MTTVLKSIDDIVFDKRTDCFAVKQESAAEIMQVANSLVFGDVNSAHNFGRSDTAKAAYLDQMLANVAIADQGDSGKRLAEIVALSRQVSGHVQPSQVQLYISKIPVVGNVVTRLLRLQQNATARFDSVKEQVEILSKEITTITEGFRQSNLKLDLIYSDVLKDVHNEGVKIVASAYAISYIEAELSRLRKELKANPQNHLLALETSNADHQLAVMKQRRSGMITDQKKMIDDMTIIRMKMHSNLGIVDKLRVIEDIHIPSAKRGFILSDEAEKSNNGSRLIEQISDSINAQARHQVDVVQEMAVRVAKQANRPIFDLSTLEYTSAKIEETLRALDRINNENTDQHKQLESKAVQWQEDRQKLVLELSENKH